MRGLITFACLLILLPTLLAWAWGLFLVGMFLEAIYLIVFGVMYFFAWIPHFPAWAFETPKHFIMAFCAIGLVICGIKKHCFKAA